MAIYWQWEDILMALLGGSLISVSSILNLYFFGRITGLSGMVFTVSRFKISEGAYWKSSFLVGLLSACYLIFTTIGDSIHLGSYKYYIFDSNSIGSRNISILGWCIGGLLVGAGTKLGNGCTSGHGVCGLPRFSVRSFLAVCLFMSSGVGVATFRYYVPFLNDGSTFAKGYYETFRVLADLIICVFLVLWLCLSLYCLFKKSGKDKYDPLLSFGTGVIFGLGLCLSGMCRRTKILNFLTLKDGWDPSLMFVMVSAISVNLPVFQFLLKKTRSPLFSEKYGVPTNTKIDLPIVMGPILFGIGWGLSGFCPGPGLVNTFLIDQAIFFFIPVIIGQLGVFYGMNLLQHKETDSTLKVQMLDEKEKKSN